MPQDCVIFQAGLLLAETEYVKQVESDIASYKVRQLLAIIQKRLSECDARLLAFGSRGRLMLQQTVSA